MKSLYGIKQTGRLWNQLLHQTLVQAGFTQSVTDVCVYYKMIGLGTIVVGVYVEKLLATETREGLLDQFGKEIVSLEVTGLGPVENFLSIS